MRRRIFNSNFANKIISMLLASAMVFTSCEAFTPLVAYAAGEEEHDSGEETSEPVNAVDKVTIGVDSYPDVDILLTKGETLIDAADFRNAVEQALAERGLDLKKIHVYAESSSDTQQDGSFRWTQYSALRCTPPYSNIRNGAGYDPLHYNRSGTITIDDRGAYSNVHFYGNWHTAGSLLSLAPVPEPQPGYVVNAQSVSFSYALNFGDSITGAGYIINAYQDGNNIVGQMLAIMNGYSAGTSYGFYAGGKSGGIFEFCMPTSYQLSSGGYGHINSAFYGATGLSLVQSFNLATAGTLNVRRKENMISVYDKVSGRLICDVDISKLKYNKIGNRFGYFMYNYDHGCSQTGQFDLNRLVVDTQSRIPFSQVMTNGSAKLVDNDLHFVVDIDDNVDDSLSSMQLISLMERDKGYDGLHFIGWGNSKNKTSMENLLTNTSVVVSNHEKALLTDADYATGMYYTDNKGILRRYRGLYLSQEDYDYQFYTLVEKTADYIYNVVLKYMNKDDVVVENPAKLFVNPVSKAYDTAVSPGQYSYGKWTINHYSKVYEGNDSVNMDLYGRRDLIEVDGDNFSASNVWPHEDKQSKYETQERVGFFENVVVGTTSKDDQIYKDENGTLFRYDYDKNSYINIQNNKIQKPKGELVGTIKTGESRESRLTDYEKVPASHKYDDSAGSTRTIIDSATMHYIGSYIVFSDWGENASNHSWIGLPALEASTGCGSGQGVWAWSLNGVTNWNSISTSNSMEYYATADKSPVEGKTYYVYERDGGYQLFTGNEFKDGVEYYQNVNDNDYYRTSDERRDYSKTYYSYGRLKEFKPGTAWGWWWTASDFDDDKIYYERSQDYMTYYRTQDEHADAMKTYYYFENPYTMYEIGVNDEFIHLLNEDYPYYENTVDANYFRTIDSVPQNGKIYYYKSNGAKYRKFSGRWFNSDRVYYERVPSSMYARTTDTARIAGKVYYYKDEEGNYVKFTGLAFTEGTIYYERAGDGEEADYYYGTCRLFAPRNMAKDTLNLKLEDADTEMYSYSGPIVEGVITPVTEPFEVTPVDGDNTEFALNRMFYAIRTQVDGGNAGLTHQYAGTGMSPYRVGKFKYWDDDLGQYQDTGYCTFQVLDLYSADEYTSEPVYKDFLVEHFDPMITSGIPVLGNKEMNYRYDNDLMLYHPVEARVGDDSDEVGLFEIFFEDELIKSIFVHRLPHAKFRLKLGPIQTSGNQTGWSSVQYINQSFDYDHYNSDYVMDGNDKLPGIVEYLWEYRSEDQLGWTVGKLPNMIDRTKRYEVRLTVWDREGEFSQTAIMIGNGDDPPIAQFALVGPDVTISKGIKTIECNKEVSYDDNSYDPNGYNLDEYRWTVSFKAPGEKNSVLKYTGTTFRNTFPEGPGVYTYTLQVKNSKGLWSNIASDSINVTKVKYNLIYDKQLESVTQYGVKSKRVFGGEYATVDPVNNYGRRTGWDFVGWGAERTSQTVYDDVSNRLMMPEHDTTIYAVFKRDLQLILADDPISHIAEQTYNKRIYTHDTVFSYPEVKSGNKGTTRDDVKYKVTFEDNHGARLVDLGGTDTSTGVGNGNVDTATRSLVGWYTGYEGEEGAIKIGNPGTTIDITPQEYSKTLYDVTGDVSTVRYNVDDKRVIIYPQWNHAMIKLPDCKRNEDKKNINGTDEDKFIGWFTKPQPDDGGSGDGGVLAGFPGDIIEITADTTLYPWFNVAPSIVHSAISDGFYEDQPVSYTQLMALVDAFDTDDWTEQSIDGLLSYRGVQVWRAIYRLNLETWLDETYPDMSSEEKQAILDTVNDMPFIPEIVNVEFACNIDANGYPCASNPDTQTIDSLKNNGLDTGSNHLGDLIITYRITDNGILNNGELIPNSPVTVEYKLHTKIAFNDAPRLGLVSKYIYSVDENLNEDNIEEFLLRNQIVTDVQDKVTNKPWWYAEKVEDFETPSDNTDQRLFDSLRIVNISDIRFVSSYEADHADVCAAIKDYTDIKDLFRLKVTDPESFKHILSFNVTVDAHDQWNKYANGKVYDSWDEYLADVDNSNNNPNPRGMREIERTFNVIMFNNQDDYDLLNYVVAESMRYIDLNNINALKDTSFWGESGYGYEDIKAILEKYGLTDEDVMTFVGNVRDANDRSVTITVNDFTGN